MKVKRFLLNKKLSYLCNDMKKQLGEINSRVVRIANLGRLSEPIRVRLFIANQFSHIMIKSIISKDLP